MGPGKHLPRRRTANRVNARALLALCALALLVSLGGCSAAGSLDMTAVNDTQLAEQASRDLPRVDDESGEDPGADYRAVVQGAVRNGSATQNGTSPMVDTEGLPFAVDGAYYDLSVEPVGNHSELLVDVKIDYNGTTDGPAVAYEDLSPADKALLDTLLQAEHEDQGEGYDFGAGARYTDAEANASVLLAGDYAAVRYRGERYPIAVDSRPVTVTTYRYTAEQVAPNAEAYAQSLRETYQFTLSGLSTEERKVVDEAIRGTYYAESTDDSAFQSVLQRFRSHDAVRSDEYSGSWVVRYDGDLYWAELHYGGFTQT